MLSTLILGILALVAPVQVPPPTVATVGKYRIELRVPEEGVYAGESIDIEFRLSDLTKRDPIEGHEGVPNATATAAVTMPAMPGMPVQRPKIHREGVPGDYGLELFFPHGGVYKIGIRLTPPGAKPIYAAFNVDVKEGGNRKPTVAPYRLQLIDPPMTGGRVKLHMAIRETKTDKTVKAFDIAHEKPFHLILVSKDLSWFAHEHPVQKPDGTFVYEGQMPAGENLIFADVAPKDRGSQILPAEIDLDGQGAVGKPLIPSRKAQSGGISASLQPGPMPVGASTNLKFDLKDSKTGKPVIDLQPYLGATGHLMIVHRDGKSFVHSHPAEDAASLAESKKGKVSFSARFPRAGTYKAWAQFQRAGKVITLPFVFEVKA